MDEIHRFNKAQQDGFLPYVERGTIVLVGATTENPSFELNAALLSRCQVLRLNRLGEEGWAAAWRAIRAVWASKFNDRVLTCTEKLGVKMEDIFMSVLCQPIIDGDYAFVLHTRNPFNNNMDEIYGEIVVGLGETLVGASEGKALSFIIHKMEDSLEILGFCNKSVVLKNAGVIFRSDSNFEDLDEFSGAGLFDSFPIHTHRQLVPRYSKEPLIVDGRFREEMIRKLGAVGSRIEHHYGGIPQDIEGLILNGEVYIVQSRPQI